MIQLKLYVEEEYKNKKKVSSYDMSEWKYYRVENLPQQCIQLWRIRDDLC